MLNNFLGNLCKYDAKYLFIATHLNLEIKAIEKITWISYLVEKLHMIAWSDFAWKTANFAKWLQCSDLFTIIRSKHQLTKLCASDWFEEIKSIQSEAVRANFPRSLITFMNFCYFLEFKTLENICPMLVPLTLSLIFFCNLASALIFFWFSWILGIFLNC